MGVSRGDDDVGLCVCVLLPVEKSLNFIISVVNSSRRNVLKEGCVTMWTKPLKLWYE